MKIREYVFEVTTFVPELRQERRSFAKLSEAVNALGGLPSANAVIYVAALGDNVDHGNFYLFLNNENSAHIMLHEHREFVATDPASEAENKRIEFLGEDGSAFIVDAALTVSAARGKSALEYWLPNQDQWPELIWQ
jgi:hypothetical protein